MAKGLTREALIDAALVIVDRDGLEALSMRKLGTELGVDPMAAYRHLPGKEALLDGLVEAVVLEVDLTTDDAESWQEQLRQLVLADLRAMLAHPNVLPLLAHRPSSTTGSLQLVERAYEITSAAGVPLHEAALAVNVMGMLTVSLAVAISEAQTDRRSSSELETLVAEIPRDEFPLIVRVIETGQFIESYDQIFDFWFGALVEQLERATSRT